MEDILLDPILVALCNNFLNSMTDSDSYIRNMAIALTLFCFRNGPIEDIHADGKLSDSDMKILNKSIVNRVALVLRLLNLEDPEYLHLLLGVNFGAGMNWDDPEIDEDLKGYLNMVCLKEEDLYECNYCKEN